MVHNDWLSSILWSQTYHNSTWMCIAAMTAIRHHYRYSTLIKECQPTGCAGGRKGIPKVMMMHHKGTMSLCTEVCSTEWRNCRDTLMANWNFDLQMVLDKINLSGSILNVPVFHGGPSNIGCDISIRTKEMDQWTNWSADQPSSCYSQLLTWLSVDYTAGFGQTGSATQGAFNFYISFRQCVRTWCTNTLRSPDSFWTGTSQ